MNVLIDIGHPGHVHLFKNLYLELLQKGHKVWVTVKDIGLAKELLSLYNMPYIDIGSKSDSIICKLINQFSYDIKIYKLVKYNKIEIGIGTSISVANISVFSKMKSIILDDDDDKVQPLFVNTAHRFGDLLLSPDVLKPYRKRKNTIFYPGLHELAYLHPAKFAPDKTVLNDLGLYENEVFFILRFNVFKAYHDIGARGISIVQKIELINMLKDYGKVFITTERGIEPELEQFQLNIAPNKVHSLMFYANLFISDSQTMTSEAAVLGTPSIRCNTFVGKIAYLEEEEKQYELTYGFTPDHFIELKQKIEDLLSTPNLKSIWQEKRQVLLSNKIDTTKFLLFIVENYKNLQAYDFNSNFFKEYNS